MIAHVGAAAPGTYTALDTHWIWQEGLERLTKEPLEIADGQAHVPDTPGLGVEIDLVQRAAPEQLHKGQRLGGGDDAAGMQ